MANENRRYALDPYRRNWRDEYPGAMRDERSRRFRGEYEGEYSGYGRGQDQDWRGRENEYGRGEDMEAYRGGYEYGSPGRDWESRGYADYGREGWRGMPSRYGQSRNWGEGRNWSQDEDRAGRQARGRGERGMWERATDEVSSWFGDEDAERRREMDHRGRGPKGYARSSERIREDVCDRLTDDYMVDASDVDVNVSGTEITLSGTVDSREQRRRAEDCAESVSGVTHVQNNLRVKERSRSAQGMGGGSISATSARAGEVSSDKTRTSR